MQQHAILKLTHFTPTNRNCWCWLLMYPCLTLLAGPQDTITGETVNHGGSTMWSGSNDYPSFATRSEALAWCDSNGITLESVEDEEAA